jgi:predicted O-linked N-acetylglucosamine transferase (SPINDLY family)
VKNLGFTTLEAKFEHARLLNQRGQLAEATATCQEILELQSDHFESLTLLAEIEARQGNPEQAIQLYTRVINLRPDHAPAYYKRGNLLKNRNQVEAALASYDQAVALDPGYANAFCNRGVVLGLLNRPDEALASYDRAIALNPGDALAYYNRGAVLRELKRLDEALASYDQAIAVRPDYAEAYCNRGVLLQALKEWDAALVSYDRCIEIDSSISHAYVYRGNLLREGKKLDAALASYNRAIEIDPAYADAYCNRGVLFTELRQWDAALASLNRAIELKSDLAEAYSNRGALFAQAMRMEAAIANFDRAVALRPDYAEAFRDRADALIHMKQFVAAISSYDQAIILKPDFRFLLGMRRHAKMNICDWGDLKSDVDRLTAGIEAEATVSPPFVILALVNSAQLQHRAAQIWVRKEHPAEHSLPAIPRLPAGDKIRLGYFSADFHDHPVALLSAEFLEAHDRSKYEVIAFSFGPDTQDNTRKRIELAFDRFIDVRGKSDQEIALLARSLSIDIAVDLGGHTGNSRTRIFALRAAPLQINYLGYPGTMGAEYMDYLIGDRVVVPEAQQRHYTEKIVYLPNSYLPHDSSRALANTVFTREGLGLPPTGIVFCCFNNNYKITPDTFESWMRILRRVENSVLWLSQNNPTAASNLRREALHRGVDAGRLIFADRTSSLPEHLARQRVADLFLDTRPYNAHATALDALWAGLPVLTCMGEGFAGRVAASLLNAIELPELITATPTQYENLAVQLAANPQRLAEIRQKLARNRLKTSLFDTRAFTKHLEAAYTKIYERYQANLPPEHIYVDAQSSGVAPRIIPPSAADR